MAIKHQVSYRKKNVLVYREEVLTPSRAIRLKCLDCCDGNSREVALCRLDVCPLWPFRSPQAVREAKQKSKFSAGGRPAGVGLQKI